MTIDIVDRIAADLRALLASGKLVDVGKGAADALDVKPAKMVQAANKLREEGHRIFYIQLNQEGTNLVTNLKVLGVASTTYADIMSRRSEIARLERLSS